MPLNNCPIQCATPKLLAADASRTFVTGVANKKIRIVSIGWVWQTAAAQVVTIRATDGTAYFRFPASYPVNSANELQFETELPAGESLEAVPAAAGPAADFVVRYQLVD